MFVKPAPDPERPGEVLIVRDPLHMRPIPREGRNVPEINYWHQRVRDGDLIPSDPPDETEIVPATKWTPADTNEITTEILDVIADSGQPAKQE